MPSGDRSKRSRPSDNSDVTGSTGGGDAQRSWVLSVEPTAGEDAAGGFFDTDLLIMIIVVVGAQWTCVSFFQPQCLKCATGYSHTYICTVHTYLFLVWKVSETLFVICFAVCHFRTFKSLKQQPLWFLQLPKLLAMSPSPTDNQYVLFDTNQPMNVIIDQFFRKKNAIKFHCCANDTQPFIGADPDEHKLLQIPQLMFNSNILIMISFYYICE